VFIIGQPADTALPNVPESAIIIAAACRLIVPNHLWPRERETETETETETESDSRCERDIVCVCVCVCEHIIIIIRKITHCPPHCCLRVSIHTYTHTHI